MNRFLPHLILIFLLVFGFSNLKAQVKPIPGGGKVAPARTYTPTKRTSEKLPKKRSTVTSLVRDTSIKFEIPANPDYLTAHEKKELQMVEDKMFIQGYYFFKQDLKLKQNQVDSMYNNDVRISEEDYFLELWKYQKRKGLIK